MALHLPKNATPPTIWTVNKHAVPPNSGIAKKPAARRTPGIVHKCPAARRGSRTIGQKGQAFQGTSRIGQKIPVTPLIRHVSTQKEPHQHFQLKIGSNDRFGDSLFNG